MADLWDYESDCQSLSNSDDDKEELKMRPAKVARLCLDLIGPEATPKKQEPEAQNITPPKSDMQKTVDSVNRTPVEVEVGAVIPSVPLNEVTKNQLADLNNILENLQATIHDVTQVEVPEPPEPESPLPPEPNTPQPAPSPQPEQESEKKLVLICRDENDNTAKVGIGPKEEFQVLFKKYEAHALKKGWIKEGQNVKFQFDEDKLLPNQSPEDLGCDDEDVIDVVLVK